MSTQAIRLFLARHGNTFNAGEPVVTVGAKMDLPLTEQGHQQAKRLADYFQNQHIYFDEMYCGPLKRQKQTAQWIAQGRCALNSDIEALNELDYGAWEGLTDAQINARWPQSFHDWTEYGVWPKDIFPMDFDAKQKIIYSWLEKIKNIQDDLSVERTILAVSSGGIIRLFLSFIPSIWKNINFKQYKVSTGHFCELLVFPDKIEIVQWNQMPDV